MITHSEACLDRWTASGRGHVPRDVGHFSCDEGCRNDLGWNRNEFIMPVLPYPERSPMPERHEVRVTNTVIHAVRLDNVLVLDEEDRSTRILHFDDLESANEFISSLAEPNKVSPFDRCQSCRDFGPPDGVKRCDLIAPHDGADHVHNGADGSTWTWYS